MLYPVGRADILGQHCKEKDPAHIGTSTLYFGSTPLDTLVLTTASASFFSVPKFLFLFLTLIFSEA
jgi:hypothetical protein